MGWRLGSGGALSAVVALGEQPKRAHRLHQGDDAGVPARAQPRRQEDQRDDGIEGKGARPAAQPPGGVGVVGEGIGALWGRGWGLGEAGARAAPHRVRVGLQGGKVLGAERGGRCMHVSGMGRLRGVPGGLGISEDPGARPLRPRQPRRAGARKERAAVRSARAPGRLEDGVVAVGLVAVVQAPRDGGDDVTVGGKTTGQVEISDRLRLLLLLSKGFRVRTGSGLLRWGQTRGRGQRAGPLFTPPNPYYNIKLRFECDRKGTQHVVDDPEERDCQGHERDEQAWGSGDESTSGGLNGPYLAVHLS